MSWHPTYAQNCEDLAPEMRHLMRQDVNYVLSPSPYRRHPSGMDKAEFKNHLLSAYQSGQLVTAKHDPDLLHITWDKPRSVLSYELAHNLEDFILNGDFEVHEYENLKFPNSPKYWEITPAPDSTFTVPGSGVQPFHPYPSTVHDRLVVVSGNSQGLHMFAENSSTIQSNCSSGSLTFIKHL